MIRRTVSQVTAKRHFVKRRIIPHDCLPTPEEAYGGLTDSEASLAGLTPILKTSCVFGGGMRIGKVETDASGMERKYFYLNDHPGSTRMITDEQGNVVASLACEPFGGLLDASGAKDGEAHRFTGKPYDDPSGLYYCGARFYDPAIGRFTTQNPAQDGVNWYGYCNDNPLRLGVDACAPTWSAY